MGIQSTIIEEIERRQLIWYGHVDRMTEGILPNLEKKERKAKMILVSKSNI